MDQNIQIQLTKLKQKSRIYNTFRWNRITRNEAHKQLTDLGDTPEDADRQLNAILTQKGITRK